MKKYRLLITQHGLFHSMSEHDTYQEAVDALPLPDGLPQEGIHTYYGMEIIRTDTWKSVDSGHCNPPIWGWVIGGVEGFYASLT